MAAKNKKKILTRVLFLSMMFCLLMGAGAQAGWKKTSLGKQYYVGKSTDYVTGWKKIKGKWYFFNEEGYLQKKWLQLDGDLYYLDKKTGARYSNKRFKVSGKYYYAAKNGKLARNKWVSKRYYQDDGSMAKGWLTLKGKTYFLNKSTGVRYTGLKTIQKKKYYFNKNGVMVTNAWKKVSGKYYYFQEDGSAAVNTWIGQYYVGKNGARTSKKRPTGLTKENGKYYYYDKEFNRIVGWLEISGGKYYFGADGAALTGLQTIEGNQYYFNEKGVMQSGWQQVNGQKYYFAENGAMVKNTSQEISGVVCQFDENGVCTDSGMGRLIAAYASKFKGGAYVYGGNNLKTGVDCSGFTQQVLAHFGIYVRRTAEEQRTGGSGSYWITNYGTVKITASQKVSAKKETLLPGDLVFYGNPAYHVALYIGDGKVIHAADQNSGIIISNFNYAKPSGARRYW